VHFVIGFYWFIPALLVDAENFAWMIPFSFLAVALFTLIYGLITLVTGYFNHTPFWQIVVFSCCWVLAELFRSYLLFPLPWNLLGYSLGFSALTSQMASLIGIYGLSFVVVFIALLFCLRHIAAYTAIAGFCLFLVLFGALRLDTAESDFRQDMYVRLVQPSIPQQDKRNEDKKGAILHQYIALSQKPSLHPISHIIWPENAFPFPVHDKTLFLPEHFSFIPKEGALIFGSDRNSQRERWNSLFVLNDQQQLISHYDKQHLVPYGEYVPFKAFFPYVKAMTENATYLSKGTNSPVLSAPSAPSFLAQICYDIIFSLDMAKAQQHAKWFVNITNDGWFGNTTAPHQHLVQAKMRAVEYGIPLVRAANSGISAIIDPYGRIVKKLDINEVGVIDSLLPKDLTNRTFYAHHPFLPLILISLFLLMGIFAGLRKFK